MSEVSFEQLLNEEGSLNQIRTGAVVKGTVIGVKENEISLNIGYKADGIVTKSEYTNDSSADLTQLVHVGDEMEVKVLKVNDGEGQVSLSYKRLAQDRSAKELVGDMVVSLGGEMALPDVSGDLNKETLLTADPDVIFVIYMAYDGDDPAAIIQQRMDAIVADPALSTVSAVKNDRVYPIMLGDVYAAGPRCMDGIRTLAQGMYPDQGN